MKHLQTTILGLCFVLVAACGAKAPIIAHRMPMEVLASTPKDDRQPVLDAYEKSVSAEQQFLHTKYLLGDISYELKIARIEKKQNAMDQSIAAMESKRSKKVFRLAAMKAADSRVKSLSSKKGALKERIRYLKMRKAWLQKRVGYTRMESDHASARFELAKAKLANTRKVAPAKPQLAKFVAQEKRTAKSLAKAKNKEKGAAAKMKAQEKTWKSASSTKSK